MHILILLPSFLSLLAISYSASLSSGTSASVQTCYPTYKQTMNTTETINIENTSKLSSNQLANIFNKLSNKDISIKHNKYSIIINQNDAIITLPTSLFFSKKYKFTRKNICDNTSLTINLIDSSSSPSKNTHTIITINVLLLSPTTVSLTVTTSSNLLTKLSLKNINNNILKQYKQEIIQDIKLFLIRNKQLSRLTNETRDRLDEIKRQTGRQNYERCTLSLSYTHHCLISYYIICVCIYTLLHVISIFRICIILYTYV